MPCWTECLSVLKIRNRANIIIFDSAWIAGVDYDEDEFDDEEYTDEENSIDEDGEDHDEHDDHEAMDANESADILQETNNFQVPHET